MEKAEKIQSVARRLSIPPQWLDALINFETGGTYSTTIKNPYSSARGLIQFTDAAARDLGFTDSLSLVNTYPTFTGQMEYAVYPYLKKYAPFSTKKQFLMSVFYPAYRNMPSDTVFPEHIRKVNPGINTIQDYINFVNSRIKKDALFFPKVLAVPVLIGAAVLVYWWVKTMQPKRQTLKK